MKQLLSIAMLSLATGCSLLGGGTPAKPAPPSGPVTAPTPPFVNRIWRVAGQSDIPAGAIYVFLGDSTLLITSAEGKPAVGRWLMSGDHQMVMIEEGLSYNTDIIEASAQRLVLRQHNPRSVVHLVFTPARTGQ